MLSTLVFDKSTGYLPPGVHLMDWSDIERLCGFNPHRRLLLKGLKKVLNDLKKTGCETFFLDGSFVSVKSMPNDYDACYDLEQVDTALLVKYAPALRDNLPNRPLMKGKYYGDIFGSSIEANEGVPFLKFFQSDENDYPKGIIKMDLRIWK